MSHMGTKFGVNSWISMMYHCYKCMFSPTLTVVSEAGDTHAVWPGGGEHWPRKGVWGCAALKPPLSRLSCSSQGPISSKRVSSQDPLLRKFGNFSLYSLNFHPNFSSQALKFGNFQLTSPQIRKFSVHKPPNLEIFSSQAPLFRGKYQFASPTLQKSRPHTYSHPMWVSVLVSLTPKNLHWLHCTQDFSHCVYYKSADNYLTAIVVTWRPVKPFCILWLTLAFHSVKGLLVLVLIWTSHLKFRVSDVWMENSQWA